MRTFRDKHLCLGITLWMSLLVLGGAVHGLWHVYGHVAASGPILDCDHSCTDPHHHHHRGHGATPDRCPLCSAAPLLAVLTHAPRLESGSTQFETPRTLVVIPSFTSACRPLPRAPPGIVI